MLNTHLSNIIKSYMPTVEQLTHCYAFAVPVIDQDGLFTVNIELSNGNGVSEIYNFSIDSDGMINMSTNGDIYSHRCKVMTDVMESINEKINNHFSREDYFERIGFDRHLSEDGWKKIDGLVFTDETVDRQRIYLDMDGTLAVFNKNATMEEVFSPGYFRSLSPIQEIVDFARRLQNEGYDVYILSGACYSAVQEKIEWLQEYMPFLPADNYVFVPVDADKSRFIPDPEHAILIDDYNKNLYEWKGLAVKCVTNINNPNPDFSFVHIDNDYETNLSDLQNAIEAWLPKDTISFEDYLYLTTKENTMRPKVVCNDGYYFYVNTKEHADETFHGHYENVEISYPSEEDVTLNDFVSQYLYIDDSITNSVIPHVPVAMIQTMVAEHGGIDTKETLKAADLVVFDILNQLNHGELDQKISQEGLHALEERAEDELDLCDGVQSAALDLMETHKDRFSEKEKAGLFNMLNAKAYEELSKTLLELSKGIEDGRVEKQCKDLVYRMAQMQALEMEKEEKEP